MTSTRKTRSLGRLGKALLAGALAGLLALAVDAALAWSMLGYPVRLTPRLVVASVAFGALVCGALEGGLVAFGRRPGTFSRYVATGVALFYGGSVYERVERLALNSHPPAVAATAGTVALLGYLVWILSLALILRSGPDGGSGSDGGRFSGLVSSELWRTPALGLGAGTVALGLALNRHLFHRPDTPAALAADATVAGAGLALAVVWRAAAKGRATMAVRTTVVVALGCAALGLAVPVPRQQPELNGEGAPAAGRSHLVLFTVDTLRQDVFSQVLRDTPEGRAFHAALGPATWLGNAVAVAPWTAPSVASLLTGLHPSEHGYGVGYDSQDVARMTRMDGSIETLAEVLLEQGYFTAAIVTNPYLHPTGGLAQGFLDYEWLQGPTGSLAMARFLARIGWLEKDAYQPATAVRRHLERLLDRLPPRRPVFLWVHLMDPHGPLHDHPDLPREPAALAPPGRDGGRKEGRYRREVRFVCRELARFVELLKGRELWPETLFVLIADHGEMFPGDGHRGRLRKKVITAGHGHALYDELVRVPFLVRTPGQESERRIDALASQVDLYGTVLDLLGLEGPSPGGDRVSFAPWLEPEASDVPPSPRAHVTSGAVFTGPERYAIRTERWKLVHSPSGFDPEELYDLAADPGETRNLAAQEEEQREELEALLTAVRAALRTSPEADEARELDPAARKQLEALGYLD